MAICEDCQQEMNTAEGCSADALILNDQRYARFRMRTDDGPRRCGDCRASSGGYHHLGCDMERCPRCRRQLISCGCVQAEDEDGEDTETLVAVVGDTVVYPAALRGLRISSDPTKPWG